MVAVVASKGRSNVTVVTHVRFNLLSFTAIATRIQNLPEKVVDRCTRQKIRRVRLAVEAVLGLCAPMTFLH